MTLDAYHALAFTIAPELQGELYIVHHPSMPTPVCGAFARSRVPESVRDDLIAAGQWHGQGALIGFVEDPTEAALVHELAHILPRVEHHDYELAPVWREFQNSILTIEAKRPTCRLPSSKPWHDHDCTFIRRAIHLSWRAVRAGATVFAGDVHIAGSYYGLSSCWDYAAALGDEPQRCAAMTFDEIERLRPPREFTDLWKADTEKQAA